VNDVDVKGSLPMPSMRWTALVALVMAALDLSAGLPSGWTDDFGAAKAQAAAENKKVLLVFSGSDWCGWCKKLDKDTLSKSDFVKPASKKFVLVMIDSPKDKSVLSATARAQNPRLVSQYDVHGYPSVVLADAEGTVIARSSGYVKGGPKAFLAKLDEMAKAPAPSGKVVKGACNCGPECWEKLLCKCCKQNDGRCCRKKVPDEGKKSAEESGMTCRQVACWTVCTEDPELAAKVDETADFLAKILKAFDEETANYFRTLQSYYDGILLHRDLSLRGKRERFVKGKCYLNLYAPEPLRTKSWCALFCDGFLSRCKKEPLVDKEREVMLLHVGARVTKKMGVGGGDRQLERFAQETNGMGRVLHELCATNAAAIRRYYTAKIQLSETDRFGPFLSLSDMAEVFSAAVDQDAFPLFCKYGKRVRKEDVAMKLRGFADEPFEEDGTTERKAEKAGGGGDGKISDNAKATAKQMK